MTRSSGSSSRGSNGSRSHGEDCGNSSCERTEESGTGIQQNVSHNEFSPVFGGGGDDDDMVAAGDEGSTSDRDSSHADEESLLSQSAENLDDDCDNNEGGDYDDDAVEEEEEEENWEEVSCREDYRQASNVRMTRSGYSSHRDEDGEMPPLPRLLVSAVCIGVSVSEVFNIENFCVGTVRFSHVFMVKCGTLLSCHMFS